MADDAIIGFGCAGYYRAKAIRENDPDGVIALYMANTAIVWGICALHCAL